MSADHSVPRPSRTARDYLMIFLKGLCMGAADVVPGVSGGTIAFISGIYDEWLDSLRRCTPALLLRLKREGIKATWDYINGNFLLTLFLGILLSLKTLAGVVLLAMDSVPVLVWAFFSGLVAASILQLVRVQERWDVTEVSGLAAGIAIIIGIALLKPAQLPGEGWILFLGGFVAICAMILPGISGSFILLLVGLYPVFLQAIHNLEIVKLLWFGTGCIAGLVIFSRFLLWLLNAYRQQTLSVLIGFLVGSLYVTWPWKQALLTTTDSHGRTVVLQQANLLPSRYLDATSHEPMVLAAIVCAAAGVALVLGLEWIALRMSSKR
jgi:putative membrane protein